MMSLRPFWEPFQPVLLTEETPLSREIAQRLPVIMLPHWAWGQLRLGGPRQFLSAGLQNLVASLRAVQTTSPDIVLTTGAGTAFFASAAARLAGARLIVVESLARWHAPSLFVRLSAPFADLLVLQSPAVGWPLRSAIRHDPVRIMSLARPRKDALAVITVGTLMPFDRLVGAAVEARRNGHLPEALWAQVGTGGACPPDIECQEGVPLEEMRRRLMAADILITHGGVGSILEGLRAGCRIVAMPRRSALREHYDDHQVEIVAGLARRGLISIAHDAGDLPLALAQARTREPRIAEVDMGPLVEGLEQWSRVHLRAKSPAVRVPA
jgi:UDP-N-acetylglucosamine transferase subunit ALG13